MNWWRWWVGWLDLNEPREMLEIAAWEYAELLGRELPDVMVEMEEDGSLYLRREGDPDPVVMNLPRMVARLPAGIDAVERQEIYASWLETLQQVLEGSDVEPSWADRLLVRLVTKEWVESSDAGARCSSRRFLDWGCTPRWCSIFRPAFATSCTKTSRSSD